MWSLARVPPQLRGRVDERAPEHWRRRGWAVHRVGQAAYVHSPDGIHHLILGVWGRRDRRPAWAGRLGGPSPGYLRRWARLRVAQAWRRLFRRADGRWGCLFPWWRWPSVQVYRWDPIDWPAVAVTAGRPPRLARWWS
jgi:hypothetical protein